MRLKEDSSSWKSSGIIRRDFRHIANGPEEPPKSPGKKNTRKWCKGVVGREHTLGIKKFYTSLECKVFYNKEWLCVEVEFCTTCGKQIRYLGKNECTKRKNENE